MGLVEEFRAGVSIAPGAVTADLDLEARLAALVARGRAAHPDLALDAAAFVRHLAHCVARAGADAPELEELEIEDLFLASACAAGVAGAMGGFKARCEARMKLVLAAATRSPELRAEVEQRVLDALLVGTAAEPPKIVNYAGQGALDRWVAVVAQRQVITLLRHESSEQRAREGAAMEAALAVDPEPEMLFAKHQYRAEFAQAMKDALGVLGERDRLLLRLHLVTGLSVESIGKMYGVAQATASRWLSRAREVVSDEVTRLLRERIKATPEEIAALAGLVASQIDLSISRLLKPDEGVG